MATLKEVIERTLFNRPNVLAADEVILRRDPARPGNTAEQIVNDLVDSLNKQEEKAEQASTLWMKQEEQPDAG